MRTTGASTAWTDAWWERSPHYLCSNTNKRNLTLDLGTDDGLALLRALIAESDAVLENFSPRVLGNFGLEWERIQRINPRCLLVRMPAFGLSGPWRDNVGFAQTMEQVTGHGVDHRAPRRPAADPAGPERSERRHARRVRVDRRVSPSGRRPGVARLLEVTMVEGALNAAAELVLEKTAYGNLLERDGNRSPHVAPQGLYRGRGDETLAGDLGGDRRAMAGTGRRARCPRVGDPIPSLHTLGGRRARHDELDARLAPVVRRTGRRRSGRGARAHAASPRRRPATRARCTTTRSFGRAASTRRSTTRWWGEQRDPDRRRSGSHRVDRWLRTPAPTLGQHNHEILVDDLGIDEARYAALESAEIIGQRPKGL